MNRPPVDVTIVRGRVRSGAPAPVQAEARRRLDAMVARHRADHPEASEADAIAAVIRTAVGQRAAYLSGTRTGKAEP